MSGQVGAALPVADTSSPAEHWRWDVVARDEDAEALVPAWRALALAGPVATFAGPWFALAQRAAFVRRPERLALHVLHRDGELVALLPLLRQRGVAARWTTLANEHTACTGLAMRADVPEVARRVLERLLGNADRVTLPLLHHDGPEWRALCNAAATLRLPIGVRPDWQGDTWLALPSSPDALVGAMPRGLARDLHGKLERLRRSRQVEFECVTGGPTLPSTLEACFALEAEGWKSFTGTPVLHDPQAARFYRELARRASATGQLALYALRVDGELIAFRYCVRAGSRLDSLKTSFAPAWARYSPGLLTQLLAARREAEDGVVRTMHLGPPSAHKLRWASGVLPLATLDVYSRRPRGRLASWVPRIRDGVGHLPAARHLASRWHALAGRTRELRHELRVHVGKRLARRRLRRGRP